MRRDSLDDLKPIKLARSTSETGRRSTSEYGMEDKAGQRKRSSSAIDNYTSHPTSKHSEDRVCDKEVFGGFASKYETGEPKAESKAKQFGGFASKYETGESKAEGKAEQSSGSMSEHKLSANKTEDMLNKASFDFLDTCGDASINLTTANPLARLNPVLRDIYSNEYNFIDYASKRSKKNIKDFFLNGKIKPDYDLDLPSYIEVLVREDRKLFETKEGVSRKILEDLYLINSNNYSQYQTVGGSPFLKHSAADYFKGQGIDSSFDNIIVGSGIFNIVDKIYDSYAMPGREQKVLMVTPIFGCFYLQCFNKNIKTSFIRSDKDGFDGQVDMDELDQMLGDNVRFLLLNDPNNPTGHVMGEDYVKKMAEVLKRHSEVYIISDEIFRDMLLSELGSSSRVEHFSLAQIPELQDRVIVMSSAGKKMSSAGLRAAFAHAPKDIVERYNKKGGIDYPAEYSQIVVARSLEDNHQNEEFVAESREIYISNITHIRSKIEELNNALNIIFSTQQERYVEPYIENIEAGNVYLLDFSGLKGHELFGKTLNTGLDIAEFLLEKAGIATVPGECSFIPAEDMTVRIVLSTPQEEINRGFIRIESAFRGRSLDEILSSEKRWDRRELSLSPAVESSCENTPRAGDGQASSFAVDITGGNQAQHSDSGKNRMNFHISSEKNIVKLQEGLMKISSRPSSAVKSPTGLPQSLVQKAHLIGT